MSKNKTKSTTKDELMELLRNNPDYYLELPPSKKKDKDIALTAMLASSTGIDYMYSSGSYPLAHTTESRKSISLDDVPLELREDRDFILSLFIKDRTDTITDNEDIGFVPIIPKRFMDDKEIVLAIIGRFPKALKLASKKLRNDVDVVKKSTEYYVENICYASDRLKRDVELQASIIAGGVDKDLWTVLMVPQEIITSELMDNIYQNDISTVFKIVNGKKGKVWLEDTLDVNVYNKFYELARAVLWKPNKSVDFFTRKILLEDDSCHRQEIAYKTTPSDNTPIVIVMEHLADQLSLDCLKSLKANSITFQNIIKKREIKEIAFNPKKLVKKNKRSRRLLP